MNPYAAPRCPHLWVVIVFLAALTTRSSAQLTELGADFRISVQGADGDPAVDAVNPAISYNPNGQEYLVIWEGDINVGEDEIFGQRVSGAGNLVNPGFRISTQGPEGSSLFNARDPALAYNASAQQFLAVWEGDLE